MSATNPQRHSSLPIAERARVEQAERDRVARFVAAVPRERRALAQADPDGEAEAIAPIYVPTPWETAERQRFAEEVDDRLTPAELAIVQSGLPAGTWDESKVEVRFAVAKAKATHAIDAISNGDGTYYWRLYEDHTEGLIVGIGEYRESVPAEIPWVCKPLAYTGGVSLVAGAPKAGKSTLAAQLQRCRETGEQMFGVFGVSTGPVLLVTEEGGVAVVHKTTGLERLQILDRKAATLAGLSFDDVLAAVSKWGTDNPGGLMFIDTLAVWAEVEDENDSMETTRALAKVAMTAQIAGLAIVLVHHARKSGGDNGEAIRGSGAILATVDIGIELTRVAPGSDQRYLDVMGRVILPERYLLDFDRSTMTYTLADRQETRLAAIEDDLDGVPSDGVGMTRSELHGLWERDPRKRIKELLDLGRLRQNYVKEGRGWGWRYWSIPAVWTLATAGEAAWANRSSDD